MWLLVFRKPILNLSNRKYVHILVCCVKLYLKPLVYAFEIRLSKRGYAEDTGFEPVTVRLEGECSIQLS